MWCVFEISMKHKSSVVQAGAGTRGIIRVPCMYQFFSIFEFLCFPHADARQDNNPQKALELFQKVVTLETEKGPEIKWCAMSKLS